MPDENDGFCNFYVSQNIGGDLSIEICRAPQRYVGLRNEDGSKFEPTRENIEKLLNPYRCKSTKDDEHCFWPKMI